MGYGIWNEGALGSDVGEEPFVPYAAFSMVTGTVWKVVGERDNHHGRSFGELHCAMATLNHFVWMDGCTFMRIENPDHALRVLLDVAGEEAIVEKIKAKLKTEMSLRWGECFTPNCLLGFIANLEAEAKKDRIE